jgi:hypothetical protein
VAAARLGFNPMTGEVVRVQRRRIGVERELPAGEEYAAMVRRLVGTAAIDPAAPRR